MPTSLLAASSIQTWRNTTSTTFISIDSHRGVRLFSRIGDFILDGISVVIDNDTEIILVNIVCRQYRMQQSLFSLWSTSYLAQFTVMFQIGSTDIRSLEHHHDIINCFCLSEIVHLRGSITSFDSIAKIMDTSLIKRGSLASIQSGLKYEIPKM
jgi:hypothetical protein